MKKVIILAVTVAFLCTAGLISNTMASEEDKGPADITMGEGGKKPAIFPHAAHQEKLKCADCHHSKDADGKQVAYVDGQKVEKCATCHNAEANADKKHVMHSEKNAAHGNCRVCHKAKDKELANEKDKALAKCTVCHPKKKKEAAK